MGEIELSKCEVLSLVLIPVVVALWGKLWRTLSALDAARAAHLADLQALTTAARAVNRPRGTASIAVPSDGA